MGDERRGRWKGDGEEGEMREGKGDVRENWRRGVMYT